MFKNKNKYKKIKKFDYHKKKLENPFFKNRKKLHKTSNINIKLFTILFIVFSVIIFIFWLLILSSSTKITNVEIEGGTRVSENNIRTLINEQLSSKKLIFLSQDRFILFNTKELSKNLINKYHFEKIKIEKKWPNKLTITVNEKPFACIWNEREKYFHIDSDGNILEEIKIINKEEDKKYPLIHNKSKHKITEYKTKQIKSYIKYAKHLTETLNKKIAEITISNFIIDKNEDTFKIKTLDGPEIFFSTKNDIDKQIEKLVAVKNEKFQENFSNKQYIDLRFGDKIYSK